MIKQHFYSRVPSRVAMLYKMNGFDTFACSKDITDAIIEKDLSVVLEQKLTPSELADIRARKRDPIYAHFMISTGEVVESCISFLENDYSGERSSYMVHSLIFDSESERIIHNYKNSVAIDTTVFKNDLSEFNITGRDVRPDRNYPELDLKKVAFISSDLSTLLTEYDPLLFKKLIAAIILAISKKIKTVHVILPNNNIDKTVEFFNKLLQVFPYHLRKFISFAGIVNDFNRFSGFKLKVTDKAIGNAPISKGCTFNFITKETYGIKDSEIKHVALTAEYLYYLIGNKDERHEMLDFVDYAYKRRSDSDELNDFKSINNILSLFRAGYPHYDTASIIPNDDATLLLFENYIRYMKQMPEEYRANIIKRLNKYPSTFTAFPKQMFSKYAKAYQLDCNASKHIFMNVCLDLIHLDLMRPQLFAFMKANYPYEDKEMQASIMRNLARVYNGEFLQEQILALFNKYFSRMDEETRDIVFKTILLSIRTPSIQQSLFAFINQNYSKLLLDEKRELYRTAAEHLGEGDELSKKLLDFCDSYIEKEDETIEKQYVSSINTLLLDEQTTTKTPLLEIVAATNGYTFDLVAAGVLSKWRNRKISREFITYSCRGTLTERTDRLIKIWQNGIKEIDDDMAKKIYLAAETAFTDYPCQATVDEIFACKEKLTSELKLCMRTRRCATFVENFTLNILNKLLCKYVFTLFLSHNPGMAEKTLDYIKNVNDLGFIKIIPILENYIKLKNAVVNSEIENTLNCLLDFGTNDELMRRIAPYFDKDLSSQINDENKYSIEHILYLGCFNYMKSRKLKFGVVFDNFMDQISKTINEDYDKNYLDIIQTKLCYIFRDFIIIADRIIFDKNLYHIFEEDLTSNDTGIAYAVTHIFVNYGKGQFIECANGLDAKTRETRKYLESCTKKLKQKVGVINKVIDIC